MWEIPHKHPEKNFQWAKKTGPEEITHISPNPSRSEIYAWQQARWMSQGWIRTVTLDECFDE